MGIKNTIVGILQRKWNSEYQKNLAKCRVEISYQKYVENQKDPSKVVRMNPAGLSYRDIVLFVQRKGEMDPNAYAKIQMYMGAHPECMVLFGDEDVRGADPIFRGDFGREEWLQTFTLGSIIAVDRTLCPGEQNEIIFDEPSEVREILHKILIAVGAFERKHQVVAHIPEVLFHGAVPFGGEVERFLPPVELLQCQKLSVVIPSKDHPEILKQCIDSLCHTPCELPLEILVVDNGSSEENQSKITRYLATKDKEQKITTGYLYAKEEFNFSKMCNQGAKAATGDVLLFLNDDIEATATEWLNQMLKIVQKPYVGAVGSRLYYPGSKKIQHLGVQNLPGGPVHKFQFMEETEDFIALGRKNVLAVTGACLMVRKEQFEEAGGFPEKLQVAYNDVALCMALHRLGYENVVCTKNVLTHHESLSRGNDLTVEKLKRLKQERNELYTMFPEYRGVDPYYSRYLSHELGDGSVNPRFFEVHRAKQGHSLKQLTTLPSVTAEEVETFFDPVGKTGYGVVLFENNAFYDRYLILKGKQGNLLSCKLTEQYNEETAFWKQEQPNCALCGFAAEEIVSALPADTYEVGVMMKRKVGQKVYFDWCSDENGSIVTLEGK